MQFSGMLGKKAIQKSLYRISIKDQTELSNKYFNYLKMNVLRIIIAKIGYMETHLAKNCGPLTIVDIHSASVYISHALPIFTSHIQAGYPSAADDYLEKALDLNELVVQHPAATFYVKVQGHSMENAGIFSGDILVVDRSLTARNKSIIVAVLDGEFTVKRLILEEGSVYLYAENPRYPPIKIEKESQFDVWGVVTYVIHKAR